MDSYSEGLERQMSRLYGSLIERDRRRYAAVEAAKLGHGGIEYISRVLGCDPATIRRGMSEMESQNEWDTHRQRKKGADANRWPKRVRSWSRISWKCSATIPPATRCGQTSNGRTSLAGRSRDD